MEVQKRNPIELSFLDFMTYGNCETPELEIVGRDNRTTEDGTEDEFAGCTDAGLSDMLDNYKTHLKSLKLNDGGLKMKLKVQRICKEIERRQLQSKKDSGKLADVIHQFSGKSIGTGASGIDSGATATSSAMVDRHRYASPSETLHTKQTGYHAGSCGRDDDTGAFCLELGMMKGTERDSVLEAKTVQRSTPCNTPLIGGTKTCPVSKFYPQVEDWRYRSGPLDLQERIQKGNCSSVDRSSTLSKVSALHKSDENDSSFEQSQNDETRSLSRSFSRVISKSQASNHTRKKAQYESTDDRCVSGKRSHMDKIGATVDTAMELSDDEEKRSLEGEAGVSNGCNNYTAKHMGLRSSMNWKLGISVAYPRGDPEAVEVRHSDLRHLGPFEFLNDTVIDFYIKYIQQVENLNDEKRRQFHFFNSFFFKKLLLEKKKKSGDKYFSKLRKWTRGVNIFDKTYLLVPLHDSAHWSLAIICFAMERGDSQVLTPYILHLDSMRAGHASEDIFQILKSYLEAEWKHMKGMSSSSTSLNMVLKRSIFKRVEVPQQENDWDCGLFLLFFIERFVKDAPPEFMPTLLSGMFGRHWFKPDEASSLRGFIKDLITSLLQEAKGDRVLEIVMEDMD